MPEVTSVTVKFDSLYWLNSLNDEDVGLSNRCMDDVFSALRAESITCVDVKINKKEDLLNSLKEILRKSHNNEIPMIHLDMHGSKIGLHLRNNQVVRWGEIESLIRNINKNTQSNLLIIQTTCFGFHHISSINIKECSPFYILLAPETEITGGFMEDNIFNFYKDLITTSDLQKSYEDNLKEDMKYYHAEEFFVRLMVRYFQQGCKGQGKKQRIERLVTEKNILEGGFKNRDQMRFFRKKLKKSITVNPMIALKYFNIFIPGRTPSISLYRLCNDIKNNKIPSLNL